MGLASLGGLATAVRVVGTGCYWARAVNERWSAISDTHRRWGSG